MKRRGFLKRLLSAAVAVAAGPAVVGSAAKPKPLVSMAMPTTASGINAMLNPRGANKSPMRFARHESFRFIENEPVVSQAVYGDKKVFIESTPSGENVFHKAIWNQRALDRFSDDVRYNEVVESQKFLEDILFPDKNKKWDDDLIGHSIVSHKSVLTAQNLKNEGMRMLVDNMALSNV